MSYVYLDNKYNEYWLDEEAYEQIVQLVKDNKHCMHNYRDRHPYTAENPCVGKNICLKHLLQKQQNLSHLDVTRETSDHHTIYYFTDSKGKIYTSTEDSSEEAKEDMLETLSYYGFKHPEKVESRGKSVDFYSYYAALYGDLLTASVVVLSYHQHNEKVKGLFLLYKDGTHKELTKRSDLYAKAAELVEASKDANGYYHINGNSHFSRFEADVYEVISQLESALYDVTSRLQNGNRTEVQHAEED
jgi:hypothetical protein